LSPALYTFILYRFVFLPLTFVLLGLLASLWKPFGEEPTLVVPDDLYETYMEDDFYAEYYGEHIVKDSDFDD